jgi:hypothetical protein
MAILRRVIDAYLGRGDAGSAEAMTAPDACLRMLGSSELAGEYRGRQGLLGWRQRLIHATRGRFELLDVHEVAGARDRVAAMVHERLTCGECEESVGLKLSARVESGRLTELTITPEPALDRLLRSSPRAAPSVRSRGFHE